MKTTELKVKGQSGIELPLATEFNQRLSFVIAAHGVFSSGKTRLGVTGPPQTFFMPIDRKSRRTIQNAMEEMGKKLGKDILMPPIDFIPDINPMQAARLDIATSAEIYRERVEKVKDYLLAMHQRDSVRLIVIDTCSQLYEEMCYASYGRSGYKHKRIGEEMYKDKSEADAELKDLIKVLASKPLLLIHTSKPEYVKGKSKPIGMMPEGMKNIGYQCEVVIEHEFNKQFDGEDADNSWRFAINVQTCQERVGLQGPEGQRLLVDDMITMGQLLTRVFPNGDWSDWE